MPHDVFISHSSKDRLAAAAICAALEAAKIRCWVGPRDVVPGRAFSGQIKRAIEQCRVMVLVFSSHSNTSEDVLREVQLAARARCHIVNFRIEDVSVSDDLDYYLTVPHWLDAITPPMERHHAQLVASVKTLLALERPPTLETGSSQLRQEELEDPQSVAPERGDAVLEKVGPEASRITPPESPQTPLQPPGHPRRVLSVRQRRWLVACSIAVAGCLSALLSSKLKGWWPRLCPGLSFGLVIAPWFLHHKLIRTWGSVALVAGATVAYFAAFWTSFFTFAFHMRSGNVGSDGSALLRIAEAGILGGAAGTTLLAATLAVCSGSFRTGNWKTLVTIGTAAGAGLCIAGWEKETPELGTFGAQAFIFLWQLCVAAHICRAVHPPRNISWLSGERSLTARRWAGRAVWIVFLLCLINAAIAWARSDKQTVLREVHSQQSQKAREFSMEGDKAFKENDWTRAIENYSAAVALGADDSRVLQQRAYARWKLGQNREAIDDYTKAIDASKYDNDAEPLNGRGVCHHNRGEYSAAIEDYTKAIELAPSEASYYLNRAQAYDAIGRRLSAAADRSKAQALTEEKQN